MSSNINKLKVGIIGCGYWGNILQEKLKNLSHIVFFTKHKSEYTSKIKNVDWVFIATPDQTHYNIVKQCLNKGVNVFCEKPLTLSYQESKELFNLAESKNLKLYSDDVFNYRNESKNLNSLFKSNPTFIDVKWEKPSRTDYGKYIFSNFYNLAWHDFYLLYPYIKDKKLTNIISLDTKNTLTFILEFNNIKINFLYDRQSNITQHKINNIDFTHTTLQNSQDPITKMLQCVLNNTVDFELNKKQTLYTNKIIRQIQLKLFPKKIAVIGGGIFGCTIAANLSKEGINVDLFEKNNDIISQASFTNQYRIHEGYHYPRSKKTAYQSKIGALTFKTEYPKSIINGDVDHYYCISTEDSLVSPTQYLNFMNEVGLEYTPTTLDLIKEGSTSLIVKTNELLFNPITLKKLCKKNLQKYNVNVILNKEVNIEELKEYDYIINSTYSNINSLLPKNLQQDYQFELCEKPIIKLPNEYKNKSIVIMDGPFMCIDPYGDTGYHVIGNVVHAIHSTNIGKFPILPSLFKPLLNKGIIKNPQITNIDKFISSSQTFFKNIEDLKHIGSMFTFRTVLPNKEKDDARPTIVKQISPQQLVVFSGKIPTCVEAFKEVLKIINK